jgi:hypothetical protein
MPYVVKVSTIYLINCQICSHFFIHVSTLQYSVFKVSKVGLNNPKIKLMLACGSACWDHAQMAQD